MMALPGAPAAWSGAPAYSREEAVGRRFASALVALACAVVVALAGGCGGPSDEQQIREGITQAFDEIANGESEARQQMVDTMSADGSLADLGVDPQELSDALFDGFDYKIGNIEVDAEQGTATAEVTLTSKTIAGVVDGLKQGIIDVLGSGDISTMTQDEINTEVGDMLVEALDKAPVEEQEISLPCSRTDEGAWTLDEDAGNAVGRALVGDLAGEATSEQQAQ